MVLFTMAIWAGTFQLDPPFSQAQHEEIAEYANMARGERIFGRDDVGDITHKLVANAGAENIRKMLDSPGPHEIRLSGEKDPIVVYGQELALPRVQVLFSDVTAVVDADPDSVKEGDAVPVTWSKGAKFKLVEEFEDPTPA